MKLITHEALAGLLSVQDQCLSLYMPTHRNHPENLQDPIKFKNLIKQAEESLQQQSAADTTSILKPFNDLLENSEFWNHTLDGLAVLGTTGTFEVFALPIPVKELVVVANSFHTKPLRKYLQSTDRYHVLGLTLNDFHLYEGNRHSLAEIELHEDVPNTINEVLGKELTEEHLAVAAYGGAGANKSNMYHGHGSRKDELDIDAERYFREVAKIVHEIFSKPSGMPIVLAALAEHHNLFRSVSKNPFLLEKGLTLNPKSVSEKELAKVSWEVIEPQYMQSLENYGEIFQQAKANGIGSDEIKEVALAAAAGRIETLLLETGKLIPGKINETGNIEKGNLEHPEFDDLLDDIGELVTKMGGKVLLVPKEKMPNEKGLAAIFRY